VLAVASAAYYGGRVTASIPKPAIPKVGTAISSALPNAIPSGAEIGAFIREQRHNAKLSLRRLADEAGVSNPYLSQIERGLRKPSAEILQQLAKGLRISAEQLYVQAGLLEDRGTSLEVQAAVVSDTAINERQKRVLLDIYGSFVAENIATDEDAAAKAQALRAAKPPSKRAARKGKKAASKATKQSAKTSRKAASKKSAVSKGSKESQSSKSTTRTRSTAPSTSTRTAKKSSKTKTTSSSKKSPSPRRPTTH
jgi:transcriptional regulator with XRE-family HTH domain